MEKNNFLLKIRCLICTILLLVLFILQKNSNNIYNNIKDYSKTNINLLSISYLYTSNMYYDTATVSTNEPIYVYDVIDNNKNMTIFPFEHKILSPINGIVVLCNDKEIVIQSEKCEYVIKNVTKSDVLVYQNIVMGEIIGTCDNCYNISYTDKNLTDISKDFNYMCYYEQA